jgi:acetoin utilization deacetylase AcuC-like enzyme
VVLAHPSSLEHDTGAHPEQPGRIVAIEHELARRDWFGARRITSEAATRAMLEAVHPPDYIDAIAAVSARGGGHLDIDTVASVGSYEAALHAAGGAAQLVSLLLAGEVSSGFSVHRPPGHHATRDRAMGFCLFNNIAVAAQHALDSGCERVLLLDWDVHHGNGTNDIFHASDRVLFISIHQSPLYPGTGAARDVGSEAGVGYTVNLPVAPGAGDAVFRSLVDHVAVPLALSFEPQLVLISAGYDAHREDPLADCEVTESGYAEMTRSMRRVAGELGAPVGLVLEGGYALGALARSVAATMEVLVEAPAADEAVPGLAPEALGARRRFSEWWPELGS